MGSRDREWTPYFVDLACRCGRAWHAGAERRGTKAVCPECGKTAAVPAFEDEREYKTSGIRKAGHPEVTFRCSAAVPETFVREYFVEYLEGIVADGGTLDPGELLQVGFLWAEIRKSRDHKALRLHEADLRSLPIRWADSLSRTAILLARQLALVESVFDEDQTMLSHARQVAWACSRWREPGGFALSRVDEPGDVVEDAEGTPVEDSGWWIGCVEDSHLARHGKKGDLVPISLYEAVIAKPEIADFLALPAGSKVVRLDSSGVAEVSHGKKDRVRPARRGSYLEFLNGLNRR